MIEDIDGLPGMILCMCPANERRCYIVTSSPIGLAHTQNDPWVTAKGLHKSPLHQQWSNVMFTQTYQC